MKIFSTLYLFHVEFLDLIVDFDFVLRFKAKRVWETKSIVCIITKCLSRLQDLEVMDYSWQLFFINFLPKRIKENGKLIYTFGVFLFFFLQSVNAENLSQKLKKNE